MSLGIFNILRLYVNVQRMITRAVSKVSSWNPLQNFKIHQGVKELENSHC